MERIPLGAGRNGRTFNEQSGICTHHTGSRRRASSRIGRTEEARRSRRAGAGVERRKRPSQPAVKDGSYLLSALKRHNQLGEGGQGLVLGNRGQFTCSLTFCCCSTAEAAASTDCLGFRGPLEASRMWLGPHSPHAAVGLGRLRASC